MCSVIINVPANSEGSISCLSRADFMQRVTLSSSLFNIVFTGRGEGVSMLLPDQSTSFEMPSSPSAYSLEATFEYSPSPPYEEYYPANSVSGPVIQGKPPFLTVEVMSEDGMDGDQNDSYLSIFIFESPDNFTEMPPFGSAPPLPLPVGGYSQMEAHAKTYYNAPGYATGDEHNLIVPTPSNLPPYEWTEVPSSYKGLGWDSCESVVYIQKTSLGGNYNIACRATGNPLLGEKAVLDLTASGGYWGSFPTGNYTLNWQAKLYNCPYEVTRVTP